MQNVASVVASGIGLGVGWFIWGPMLGASNIGSRFAAGIALANSGPDFAKVQSDPTTAFKATLPIAAMWYTATFFPLTSWNGWPQIAYLITSAVLGLGFNLPNPYANLWR